MVSLTHPTETAAAALERRRTPRVRRESAAVLPRASSLEERTSPAGHWHWPITGHWMAGCCDWPLGSGTRVTFGASERLRPTTQTSRGGYSAAAPKGRRCSCRAHQRQSNRTTLSHAPNPTGHWDLGLDTMEHLPVAESWAWIQLGTWLWMNPGSGSGFRQDTGGSGGWLLAVHCCALSAPAQPT